MGRSGVLPSALGRVSPTRRTPDNAIHLQVACSAVTFLAALIWGIEDAFFTWALMITLGLIIMYVLCNIGVVRYYRTEGRPHFNVLLHLAAPVVASIAVLYVGYKSVVPLPPAPEKWGPVWLLGYLLIGVVILLVLKVRSRGRGEAWLRNAQSAFEAPDGGATVGETTVAELPAR